MDVLTNGTVPSRPIAVAGPDRAAMSFVAVHVAAMSLVIVVCLTVIGSGIYEPRSTHDLISLVTGLAGIGLIVYARYFLRLPWLNASVVYLMLFWMFHFGMSFTTVMVPSMLDPFGGDELEWLYYPNVRLAMILGVMGAASFVLSTGLLVNRTAPEGESKAERSSDPGLYLIGWAALIIGIAGSVIVMVQNVGLGVFSMGYLSFLALAGSSMLGTTLGLSHLGCLLALCGARGRQWVQPLAVWGVCIALPMLLIGARSGAMISAVGFAVVLTHRGIRLSRGLLAAAVVVALVAIPAIQAFRLVGFANRSSVNWTDVTPLDTLMELGGSLRATKAYVDWIEQGDAYLLGASYWAPFDRQVLGRIVPGHEPVDYWVDPRIPAHLMDEREAGVGGSATGEAYYNFGPLGPVMFFTFVGALFGLLERRAAATPYACAMLGVIMFLFFFNIRGDWLPIPAQIAEGLFILAGCYALGQLINARAGNPGHPASQSVSRA